MSLAPDGFNVSLDVRRSGVVLVITVIVNVEVKSQMPVGEASQQLGRKLATLIPGIQVDPAGEPKVVLRGEGVPDPLISR